MHSRVGGVAAEQPSFDEVTRGRRLGALRQVKHERRLLRGQPDLRLAELDHPPGRVEFEPSEPIVSRATCTSLDEAGGEI